MGRSGASWAAVSRRFALLLALYACVLAVAACKKPPSAERAATPPTVTDAAADLLFTWIDEKGGGHVEQRVADVPVTARDAVRVVDPAHEPPPDQVWIADLRNAGAGGAYPVQAKSRAEWEALAAERRGGGALAARPAQSAAPEASPAVIIYGASWCGPCHQAAAYLKQRGVAFVEKDIEEDGGAAREMRAKLAKAGKRGGSIPVLDVRGRILVGFDARAVDVALGEAM